MAVNNAVTGSMDFIQSEPAIGESNMVKCVVVGDTGVGKSRLICRRACGTLYTLKQLVGTHVSAVWAIDHYRNDKKVLERSWCKVDGVNVSLQLWDTFGYHDKNRSFAYGRADVVLICFDAVNRRTLQNIKNHWYPEVQRECPRVPIVVCACKADLRHHYNEPEFIAMDKGPFYRPILAEDIVSPEEGRLLADSIGADYYETSVWAGFGVDDVFNNVARSALYSKRLKNIFSVLKSLKHVRKPRCQAPYQLPRPPPPSINVGPSNIDLDMKNLLELSTYSDVVFIVQGVWMHAHRICLMAASPVFEELFSLDIACVSQSDNGAKNNENHSGVKKFLSSSHSGSKLLKDTAKLLDNEELQCSSNDTLDLIDLSACAAAPPIVHYPVHEMKHPAFTSLQIQYLDVVAQCAMSQKSYQIVITLNSCITPAALQAVLIYLYSGDCTTDYSLLTDVCIASRQMGLHDLQEICENALNNEGFRNLEIQNKTKQSRLNKLFDLAIKQGLCTDVQFQVDNGVVNAHRSLMMARCDMMQSMFSYNFREAGAKKISFPGTSRGTFLALLEFLYTGNCTNLVNVNMLQLIALANRLCLPRLLSLGEQFICQQLTSMETKGQDVMEEVFELMEPAQLHNAYQLAEWCSWYLCVNYRPSNTAFNRLLRTLCPDNQVYITSHKWPPAWYLKEEEYYERCLIDLEREKLGRTRYSIRRSKSEDDDGGCLGFCSRNRQKVKCEQPPAAVAI